MGDWVTPTLATGSFNQLFFTHCDNGFQPSPKLTLVAPLRRRDARTNNYARTGRGLGTGALALTSDGEINVLTWGIRTVLFAQCDAKPEAHGEKKTAKPTINQLSCQAAAPSGVRLPHCLPTRRHVKESLSSSARVARTFGAPPRSGGGATQNRRRYA